MTGRRPLAVLGAAALMMTAHAVSAHVVLAQTPSIRRADSLLAAGALDRAESAYYAAVQARPRDPTVRWALGVYLAKRGALRVAATLFEEALQFGGEPSIVSADLAPIDLALGKYDALLALPGAPLDAAQRVRVRWLVDYPTRLAAPDSVEAVAYQAVLGGEAGSLGHMTIRMNGRAVDAVISVRTRGIVVSDTTAATLRLHRFTEPRSRVRGATSAPAVADSIGIGSFTLIDYPVDLERTSVDGRGARGDRAIEIGVDVLARFAPTFDARAGRITLRAGGSVPAARAGERTLPTLVTASDFVALDGGRWTSVASPAMARRFGGRPWTIDAKRGRIVLGR